MLILGTRQEGNTEKGNTWIQPISHRRSGLDSWRRPYPYSQSFRLLKSLASEVTLRRKMYLIKKFTAKTPTRWAHYLQCLNPRLRTTSGIILKISIAINVHCKPGFKAQIPMQINDNRNSGAFRLHPRHVLKRPKRDVFRGRKFHPTRGHLRDILDTLRTSSRSLVWNPLPCF